MTDPNASRPLVTLSAEEYACILRSDLTSFIEGSFYELHPGQQLDVAPHIEVIATKLEALRRGDIKRLIINLPPRHLKSHCVSVAFVAWLLGDRGCIGGACRGSWGVNVAARRINARLASVIQSRQRRV